MWVGETNAQFVAGVNWSKGKEGYREKKSIDVLYAEDKYKPKRGLSSFAMKDTASYNYNKWFKSDRKTSLIAAGGLIALGLYTYKDKGFLNRKSFREQRNRYIPNFHNKLDDYVQYIPYAGIYILDYFGVKSKHKTMRKTTSMLTALALNGIVVQTMKRSIRELRPDGSSRNSFPSGHTTTAFMGAHIFHKEYGHKSPYYSIAAYSLASTAGLFRQLNNRHWISDVLVGAGLGIGLTELAYFINSKIYKNRGINKNKKYDYIVNFEQPSFISIKMGYAKLSEAFNSKELGISSQGGFNLSLEGAYFFNPYVGLGAELSVQSFPLNIKNEETNFYDKEGLEAVFQPMGSRKFLVGPYFQYGFGKSMIGTKFLMGTMVGSETELKLKEKGAPIDAKNQLSLMKVFPHHTFAWSTGFYYKHLIDSRLALGVYFDYSASDFEFDERFLDDIKGDTPIYIREEGGEISFNTISIGISLSVMLW